MGEKQRVGFARSLLFGAEERPERKELEAVSDDSGSGAVEDMPTNDVVDDVAAADDAVDEPSTVGNWRIPAKLEDTSEPLPEEPRGRVVAARGLSTRERLRNLAQSPLSLLAIVFVALALWLLASVGEDPPEEGAVVVEEGTFPEPDFRTAERGAVTEGDVATLLAKATSRGGGESADEQGKERLYTEQEVAAVLAAAQAQMAAKPTGTQATKSGERTQRRARARRKVGPPAAVTPVATPAAGAIELPPEPLPAYLFGSSVAIGPEETTGKPGKAVLEIATRFRAALEVGISSARHGAVVARTLEAIKMQSGATVAAGAVLTGRSSSGGNRIYIEFRGLEVDGKVVPIKAVATTGSELGVVAQRIESPVDERAGNRAMDGTLGALKGIASLGGVAGRMVAGAADGAVDETRREFDVDHSVVLHVPAGTNVVVVVTE